MVAASRITAILLAGSLTRSFAAGPPDSWVQAGTGALKMCAGAKSSCNSVESCTYHAYGPCGGAATPPVYIEGSVQGMALIKGGSEAYLTDNSLASELTASNIANNKYVAQDANLNVTQNGATSTYARLQAGAFYGDPTTSGVFLGMAAYLAQTGSFTSNMNSVLIPTTPGQTSVSSYDVCVAPLTNGACGPAATYDAGAYKFSLFGYTIGSSFAVPANVTHIGFRTKMAMVGTAADLKINGDKTLSTIGSADVSYLTITGSGKTMTLTFPNQYNEAPINQKSIPAATKTVKIKISAVANEPAIYVDYLFEKITAADRYFIYDPESKETTGSGSGSGNVVSKAYHAAMLFSLVTAFVSGLMHI